MEEFIKIIISLKEVLLVLTGGLIGVMGNFVVERYKRKQNMLKEQRERLEKLYLYTDKMLKQIKTIEMYQKTKAKFYLDQVATYSIDTHFGMIVDFYFPEIKNSKKELLYSYSLIVMSFTNTEIEQNRFDTLYTTIKSFMITIENESHKLH